MEKKAIKKKSISCSKRFVNKLEDIVVLGLHVAVFIGCAIVYYFTKLRVYLQKLANEVGG